MAIGDAFGVEIARGVGPLVRRAQVVSRKNGRGARQDHPDVAIFGRLGKSAVQFPSSAVDCALRYLGRLSVIVAMRSVLS
jgi:hypothetical protein